MEDSNEEYEIPEIRLKRKKKEPKSDEEVSKAIEESLDNKFSPFQTVGGRYGNMTFPMDQD